MDTSCFHLFALALVGLSVTAEGCSGEAPHDERLTQPSDAGSDVTSLDSGSDGQLVEQEGGGTADVAAEAGLPSDQDADGLIDAVPAPPDSATCLISQAHLEIDSQSHLPVGTELTYPSNPPMGGDHYPAWLTWGAHGVPARAGFWVHNLEHGGVVFFYRCASRTACPELADALERFASTLPRDPGCKEPVRTRTLVLPAPDLPEDTTVATAAWGYNARFSCVDAAALTAFYIEHVGRTHENTCFDGTVADDPG